MISDASYGEPASINDLASQPRIIDFHTQSGDIRKQLAMAGPGAQFYAVDVVAAFRNNQTALKYLHLMVITCEGLTGVPLTAA